MNFRFENLNQVRLFSVFFTMTALSGDMLLHRLMLSDPMFDQIIFPNALVILILSAPLSYFIGLKMLKMNRLTRQMEHAVNHDHLTGTCTRTHFYRRLAKMSDDPKVLIVADIDHFKKINDEHGHQAGDRALRQFATTLLRSCRSSDLIARFGGEEFVILLRNITLDNGAMVAQRLCDRVRERSFTADGQELSLTASFGIAAMAPADDIDTAFHRADQAAYRAKREGRDRVCQFDPALDAAVPGDQDAA